MLESGELDLRVAWLTAPLKTLRSTQPFQDRLVCIADRSHAHIGRALTLEQFLSPHARGQGPTTTSQVLQAAVDRLGRRFADPFLVQNFQTIPYLLPGTDLISVVPRMLAIEYSAQHQLQILEPPLRLPAVRYAAYWHERKHRDPGHQWLRARLVEVCRGLDAGTA
jgi:DNA-binding transcriptional LysR family regulator